LPAADLEQFSDARNASGVKSAIPGAFPVPRYSEMSPVQLVRECAGSRDPDAWAEFIRRFQPVIAAAVLRTARQWREPQGQLLDDLVQETYLKLCENESRMLRLFEPRHEDSIFGYMKVVAANVVHDHFKSAMAGKRGATQTETLDEPAEGDPKTAGIDNTAMIHQNLQLKEIDQVLTQVTAGKDQERKRTIFWLRHQQGLTASEIAALPSIGLTTEGVESVLLRLSIMIRSHINKKKVRSG
jgi:RNA polymerase sigma-70 factor, ECF subfamily